MKILIMILTFVMISGCGLLNLGADDRANAYIYENRETGELLFCSNDQGQNVRDFKYVGTGKVKASEIKYCELEKN